MAMIDVIKAINDSYAQGHADAEAKSLQLIRRMRDGMREWAHDTDGVHDSAWEAYADACELLGEPRPDPGV